MLEHERYHVCNLDPLKIVLGAGALGGVVLPAGVGLSACPLCSWS